MRPAIFLDIDGVVVTPRSLEHGGPKCADQSCVAELNRIVDAADADIVVTSSWRMRHTLDEIRAVLEAAGLESSSRVIGQTEHLHYKTGDDGRIVGRAERSDEIRNWLKANRRDRYVILDDDYDAEIPGHFVRTSPDHGLTREDADRALAILLGSAVRPNSWLTKNS
jgi:hypothetical protein